MSTNASFGRYRIGAALGQGGMATVHEAWIVGPDGFTRRVALKRLRRDASGAGELAKLFSDEARIASHLHHANLVGIVDYGIEDGVPFQALELVEGTTLEALRADLESRGESMPEAIAIHVAREVAHGLAYAHRATDENGKLLGLVHRDVSPSNVLVGWNGDVLLSDFGIAFARGRQTETAHGTARGKPSYMAPEQATRGTIDARTDLFALGCTLHYALKGKSPLEGDEVLLRMLVGESATLDPTLPEDLRNIIGSALSPERRDRPASADAMNEALDAAYRARSTRDGRSELRAFLGPIRKRIAGAVAVPETTRAEPIAPPTRRARWVAPAILATVAATVLIASRMMVSPSPPPSATIASHDAAVIVDAAPDPIDAAVARDAASLDAGATPTRTPRAPHPTTADEIPTTAGSGWLRVVAGCDAARAGSVSVDGRAGDHVPTTLRVPVGTHRVRVLAADGTSFDGEVDVTAFHTEGSPAWFRACDP